MLSERIQKSSRGFSVIKNDDGAQDRRVFFGTYSFKEAPDFIPELKEIGYWRPMEDCEVIISGQGCFVYVAEKVADEVVEEARFYWSATNGKQSLEITTSPTSKKYGEQAFEIDLKWGGGSGEPINNEYIFLKSIRGEKYNFLRKTIGGNGKTEEKYIYIVPEGDEPDHYSVAVLPQLKEKYNVVIE